jgi:hypothetical protein
MDENEHHVPGEGFPKRGENLRITSRTIQILQCQLQYISNLYVRLENFSFSKIEYCSRNDDAETLVSFRPFGKEPPRGNLDPNFQGESTIVVGEEIRLIRANIPV